MLTNVLDISILLTMSSFIWLNWPIVFYLVGDLDFMKQVPEAGSGPPWITELTSYKRTNQEAESLISEEVL